ncbi:hypothetical protein LC971_12260, partial [Enterococcus faecium]|nr:hypothetical protein [Enterococcus faecium]MCH3457786.1 hypothetical protein [Enterococcus faecium]MCH3460732.1 hypothetical protein [Enterococcus faecium]MCH3471739.1 hypothetical protein [Enterococcus faecium]MCH3583354.1 hypothetical protein [Enterococcus faecium]
IVIPPAIFFYYSTLFDSRFKTLQQNRTGNFLRWKSYIDDGRVGNVNQANATKSGSIQGMALYAREGFKYFAPNGPGWTMNIGIYYTYNPVAGTYYVVQNI